MDRLKRMSSKFGLGKSKDDSRRHSEPIFEEIPEPAYDCIYDKKPDRRKSTPRRRVLEDKMENLTPPGSGSRRTPVSAPARWEEWGPPPEYAESPRRKTPREQWSPPVEYDPPPRPETPPHHRSKSANATPPQSPYGDVQLPLFGKQYGISTVNLAQNVPNRQPTKKPLTRPAVFNPYEDMMRQADADMQRAFVESMKTAGNPEESAAPELLVPARQSPRPHPQTSHSNPDAFQHPLPPLLERPKPRSAPPRTPVIPSTPFHIPNGHPTSCIICTEDFTPSLRPPGWISLACLHHPSVCTGCISKCISTDLDNKIWNQIKCPECDASLIYEDIKRLADPATFARYEILSFRSALSTDENFVWCQNCSFGQLHASGASQPIVRCLSCNFRSCFRHSVPWHDRITCEEYDAMLADPENFRSAIEIDDAAAAEAARRQQEEDERVAREFDLRNKRDEEERQRRRHEEELRKARKEQEAEVERRKKEAERLKRVEEMKRRQKEDNASLATVKKTTKPCPGCRWAIEKNDGCAHMTCTQCRHQFCWKCLGDWAGHGSHCWRI